MQDLLGREFKPDQWVVKYGGGNGGNGYGMILHRITKVTDKHIRAIRLEVDYRPKRVTSKEITIKNVGTLAVIEEIPTKYEELFIRACTDPSSFNDDELTRLAWWIHRGQAYTFQV